MDKYIHTKPLTSNARLLRKNSTEVEKLLWSRLRDRRLQGYKFRRQYPIGRYVVDFCCVKQKVVVELDGSQHFEDVTYDEERTSYLESQGYAVVRFWNNEVNENLEGVLEKILEVLEN